MHLQTSLLFSIQAVKMLHTDRLWLLEQRAHLRNGLEPLKKKTRTSNRITTAAACLYEYESASWVKLDLSLPLSQHPKSLNKGSFQFQVELRRRGSFFEPSNTKTLLRMARNYLGQFRCKAERNQPDLESRQF